MSSTDDAPVAAHAALQSHRYTVHFPPHPARTADPHYVDFNHYHVLHRPTARCWVGAKIGYADCRDAQGVPCPDPGAGKEQNGLELHHAYVEFSLQQGVDLAALEADFPGISNPNDIGAWVESDANFRWLCVFHHRGPGGAHTASHSDWTAESYVRGLISGPDAQP